MFPLMFIAAYGLCNFLVKIQSKKEKIILFVLFIFSHSIYSIHNWEKIYFTPYVNFAGGFFPSINNLIPTFQNSIQFPVVYLSTIALIIFLIISCIKIKKFEKAPRFGKNLFGSR